MPRLWDGKWDQVQCAVIQMATGEYMAHSNQCWTHIQWFMLLFFMLLYYHLMMNKYVQWYYNLRCSALALWNERRFNRDGSLLEFCSKIKPDAVDGRHFDEVTLHLQLANTQMTFAHHTIHTKMTWSTAKENTPYQKPKITVTLKSLMATGIITDN